MARQDLSVEKAATTLRITPLDKLSFVPTRRRALFHQRSHLLGHRGSQGRQTRAAVQRMGLTIDMIPLRGFELALQVGVTSLTQLQDIVHKNDLALHEAVGEELLDSQLRKQLRQRWKDCLILENDVEGDSWKPKTVQVEGSPAAGMRTLAAEACTRLRGSVHRSLQKGRSPWILKNHEQAWSSPATQSGSKAAGPT